jgi:hypothetical protein
MAMSSGESLTRLTFFEGQKPSGKDGRGGEEALPGMVAQFRFFCLRQHDSITPSNACSIFLKVQIVECCCFVCYLRTDRFHDLPSGLSGNNLRLLDSRLADQQQTYVRHTEVLPAGQHLFHCGEDAGTVEDSSDSPFVLGE